jgi:WD40-like Beta Propeller Repeat
MRGVLLIGLLFVAAVPQSAGSSASREQASRLVFAATIAYLGGEPQTQIYALEPSGRGLAQLTFGAAPASNPAPSPDGRRIAFELGKSSGKSFRSLRASLLLSSSESTLAQARVTALGVWSRGCVVVSTGLGHAQAFGNGVRRSQACVG